MSESRIRRRLLPGTDLNLSVICLGGVPFGGDISEDDSFRLLDAYAARGGNFVDTAEIYSNWLPGEPSRSETRIGRWLRSRGLADKIIVATKGGHQRLETMHLSRLSPADLRYDIDGSLDRLGLDSIPLYYLHRDDPATPVGEIMETLAEAVAAGKIRYLGCSNWKRDRLVAAQAWAADHGRPGFVVNQPRFSLAPVNPESQTDLTLAEMDEELYAYHLKTNLPAVAYSSQAQGFFSGAYGRHITNPAARFGPKVISYYASEANYARLDRVTQLARQLGRPTTHVALAWLMAQPFPVYPAVGPASLAHLEDSLGAHDLDLTPDQARWLDRG
jgi:aryl-alcohol dehydrogenase-like predicted oxidoreductase